MTEQLLLSLFQQCGISQNISSKVKDKLSHLDPPTTKKETYWVALEVRGNMFLVFCPDRGDWWDTLYGVTKSWT